MLLPIIILWWAKAPMRFATGRWRIQILSGLILASIVLWLDYGGQSVHAADPRMLGVEPSTSSMMPQPNATHGRHREGTRIENIDGKIVLAGRRYLFVINAEISHEPSSSIPDGRWNNLGQRVRSEDRGPDQFWNPEPSFDTDKDAKMMQQRLDGGQLGKSGVINTDVIGSNAHPHTSLGTMNQSSFMLTENLMLQRIAHAMAKDSVHDQWTVSGVMTEFDDENYLTLVGAKRSSRRE